MALMKVMVEMDIQESLLLFYYKSLDFNTLDQMKLSTTAPVQKLR
jgi:hypothetical protein